MKSIFFLSLIAVLPFFAAAQRDNLANSMYTNSGLGVPSDIVGKKDLVGSEFLDDSWTNAIVKLKNNQIYKDILLKYNVLDDVIYFQGEKEVTMKFVIPVAEFSLLPDELHKAHRVFKNGFPKVSSFSDLSFYQVLVEGNAILLKKDLKKIIENREYNSAVTTKEVVNSIKYFLFYNGKIIEIKKDKTFFIAQLGKSEELGKFIADNNVNFKNETHLIRFIDYFNTLTK